MTKKIKAWPFSISRNYNVDYRVVVAPDFLVKAEKVHLLSYATEEIGLTESNLLVRREVYGDDLLPYTIFFRVVKARKALIDREEALSEESLSQPVHDEEFLVDEFGRDIILIEGIAIDSVGVKSISIGITFFEDVCDFLTKRFKIFWEGETSIKVSDSIYYDDSSRERNFLIREMEALKLNESSATAEPHLSVFSSKKKVLLVLLILSSLFLVSKFFGKKWESISLDSSTREKLYISRKSISDVGEGVYSFDYRLGNKENNAQADCNTGQVFLDSGESINFQNQVNQPILDFICSLK